MSKQSSQKQSFWLETSITLAKWQLHHNWQLLLFMAIAILFAVVLICASSLYARVAFSAGLRVIITHNPENSVIAIRHPMITIDPTSNFRQQTNTYNQILSQELGPFLTSSNDLTETVVQTSAYTMRTENGNTLSSQITLHGYNLQQIANHIVIQQGYMPRYTNDAIEIALPAATADHLHATVGSEWTIDLLPYTSQQTNTSLKIRVSAIFQPLNYTDPFWQRSAFHFANPDESLIPLVYAVTSDEALLDTLKSQKGTPDTIAGAQSWFYPLDIEHLDADQLPNLITRLEQITRQFPVTSSPLESLKQYQDRITIIQAPVMILFTLITSILLLFVGLISRLILEQRRETIAVLRSRGASRNQIMSSFIIQGGLICLITIVIGPLISLCVVYILVSQTLPTPRQTAFNVLIENFGSTLGNTIMLASIMALTAFLVNLLAIYPATKLDVLVLRRKMSQRSYPPLWQRFYFDIFLALIAISVYAIALYESNSQMLDNQTQILILSPLILITAACALIACVLLISRLLPFILRFFDQILAQSKNSLPVLTLNHIIGSSRQLLSSTLLLSLSTACAVFILLFNTAQTQHVANLATYMVGADFSGTIKETEEPTKTANRLWQIPGVKAVSLGYLTTMRYDSQTSINLKAIEPDTFRQAVIWSDQYADIPLDTLLNLLKSQRATNIEQKRIPAIVDEIAWKELKLVPGQTFKLSDDNMSQTNSNTIHMTFVAVAQVKQIPTTSNPLSGVTSNQSSSILVDYNTYDQVYQQLSGKTDPRPVSTDYIITPNYFWLHTQEDSTTLSTVRTVLTHLHIDTGSQFYDRQALLDLLYSDPLYIHLIGVFTLGALTSLQLAILACFFSVRTHIQRRMKNFVVLRALGITRRQLTSMLIWEQLPIYIILLLIGAIGGWLLSSLILPALVLSSLTAQAILNADALTGSFAQIANLPDLHIVVPREAWIAFALLTIVSLLSMSTPIRSITTNLSLSVLRHDEEHG